mmetsp:Transcript_21988/g.40147  ORF Transcript_21988/g.40147 Transcript_21988/m.40147 type:complete len:452 (-) Transcript_21988:49-1404(-)
MPALPCPALCKECIDDSTCLQCEEGLTFNEAGECALKECGSGFYLDEGKCTECDASCSECDLDGCFACTRGTILVEGSCECEAGFTLSVDGSLYNCEPDCSLPGAELLHEQCSSSGPSEEAEIYSKTNVSITTGYALVMAGSFLFGSPQMFTSMFMTNELIASLPLINIDLTESLVSLIVGSIQINKIPNYVKGIECLDAPKDGRSYFFDCRNLLRVAQKEVGVFLMLLNIHLLLKLGNRYRPGFAGKFKKIFEGVSLQVLLVISYGMFLKSLVFALNSKEASIWALVNWGLILAFYSTVVMRTAKIFSKIRQGLYQHDLKSRVICQVLVPIMMLYRFAHALFVVILNSPPTQFLILAVLSLTISIYFLTCRPFLKQSTNFQLGLLHVLVASFEVVMFLKKYKDLSNSWISSAFLATMCSILISSVCMMLHSLYLKLKEFSIYLDRRQITL